MQQTLLTQMSWDHAGRRLELYKVGGTPWRFIYDPTASVPAVVVEDLNGTPQAFYVREPDGRLIAREAGENLQYYFFDLLGSTILMAPATEGNPTDRFYYTPWGQTVTTGSRASTIATTANPYRYVGSLGYYYHHQDPNLADWMQLGVRFYKPELGRFERRDPVPDIRGILYSYCRGRPLAAVDPTGEIPFLDAEANEDIAEAGYIATACARLISYQVAGITRRYYPKEDPWGDNRANAFLHCLWSCKTAKQCGLHNAAIITDNHEKHRWNSRTGPMDLYNNYQGLLCASRGCSSCADCCRCSRSWLPASGSGWPTFPEGDSNDDHF